MQYKPKLYLLNWWRRNLLTEPPNLSISKIKAKNKKLTWPPRGAGSKLKQKSLTHCQTSLVLLDAV
jgi:hypothetical protein